MCCTARPWEIIRSFTVEMMHRSMTCWKISISNISATQNTAAPFSTPFWAMLLRFHENDIESILTKDSTGNSVTEILNYLNRHYQSVTLREAAKHFGYSTFHFSTLIKESTGRTFLQIIRDIKLNQACHALRETSLSNLAICELVGYESPEHFMRTFKKTYGMTPDEYRKKNRE